MPAGAEKEADMAENENAQPIEEQQEPQGTEQHETDWKAEARKWEARAKKGAEAEKELAELKAAQMTEQEKLQARAEQAENELAALKAEAERANDAREVAKAYDVPASLLEYCKDRDAMERFAKEYAEQRKETPVAPKAHSSRLVKQHVTQAGNRDVFAALMAERDNRA